MATIWKVKCHLNTLRAVVLRKEANEFIIHSFDDYQVLVQRDSAVLMPIEIRARVNNSLEAICPKDGMECKPDHRHDVARSELAHLDLKENISFFD